MSLKRIHWLYRSQQLSLHVFYAMLNPFLLGFYLLLLSRQICILHTVWLMVIPLIKLWMLKVNSSWMNSRFGILKYLRNWPIPSLKIVFHLLYHWWIVQYHHQSVNCTPWANQNLRNFGHSLEFCWNQTVLFRVRAHTGPLYCLYIKKVVRVYACVQTTIVWTLIQ